MKTKDFQKKVWDFYKSRGRTFSWRNTTRPYNILVSEVMLQQTQTARVTEKYHEFLERFPTFKSLTEAPLKEVLVAWQGLGYNRRGKFLKKAAEIVHHDFKGNLSKDKETLMSLPGIGEATAGAIQAYAFNMPVVFIETNIRTVFIHEFFKANNHIHDKDLLPLIEKTLDRKNPRQWYYAITDYGVYLKKHHKNPGRKSRHYTKKSPFKGSNREVRSRIISFLLKNPQSNEEKIAGKLSAFLTNTQQKTINKNIHDLHQEGFLVKDKELFSIE